MRDDMDKVLTERPRYRGWKATRRVKGVNRRLHKDIDGNYYDTKEGMRRQWKLSGQDKDFSDLIGPLYKFVRSRVGKLWDDVYSEVRERISPDSFMQMHLFTHLMRMVERDVYIKNGKLYSLNGDYEIGKKYEQNNRYDEFYVHPETGVLCVIPARPKYRREVVKPLWKDKTKLQQYVKHKGIWWIVTLQLQYCGNDVFNTKCAWNTILGYDVLLKKSVYYHAKHEFYKLYGGNYFAVEKRQIDKKEIRRVLRMIKEMKK